MGRSLFAFLASLRRYAVTYDGVWCRVCVDVQAEGPRGTPAQEDLDHFGVHHPYRAWTMHVLGSEVGLHS